MKITYEQWQSISEDFANEAITRLGQFASNLKPEPSPEPVKAYWDENGLKNLYRVLMADSLLSIVTVERPTYQ